MEYCAYHRGLKATTGIVGIEVDPYARLTLEAKTSAVLAAIQVIEPSVQYRKNVEATFQSWMTQVCAYFITSALGGAYYTLAVGKRDLKQILRRP